MVLCVQPLLVEATPSDAMERFKQYLNDTVTEVKQADDPAEKRAILDRSLRKMTNAAERVKEMRGVDADDQAALDVLIENLSEKLYELNGEADYEPVADADLDDFADYAQQDLEQAQRLVISISATALVLILLLILLL